MRIRISSKKEGEGDIDIGSGPIPLEVVTLMKAQLALMCRARKKHRLGTL